MALPPPPPGHPAAARRLRIASPFPLARVLSSLLVALALAASPPVAAQGGTEETVTVNFVNADIEAVVKAVSEITGRNFVLDPKVKGTINIVSAQPVPRRLVYPTFLSALRLQGFAAVEGEGGIVKIVPEVDAKQQGGTVGSGPVRASGDRLVTQVIVVRNESAAQLVNVLRPLITPNNTIAALPGSNALIVTDYADNLRRIERIVASLDQPPSGEPTLVALRHASAIDVAALVARVLADPGGAPADAQQRVSVVADPRSNSVLIRADNAARGARVKAMVEQLDTPGRAGGNLFVVYLKNAEAAKVVQTLRGLLTGSDGGTAPASGLSPATPTSLASSGIGPTAQGGMATPASTTPLPFAPPAPAVSFSAAGATVTADPASNSLVIMAPEPVYNNLRAIIDKLDVRRAQVFVEALIVEVSADKAAELGIQWQALSGYNTTQTRVIGGTNFTPRGSGNNIIDVAISPGAVGQGLSLGVMRGTVTIPGLGTITNLAFLARALETQIGANILSTPTLLTLDNEEARIIVGQNIPILTGSYATTGGTNTVTPFQTFERKDVGIVLRVKPQIAEGGTVRLVLYEEVSRVEEVTPQSGVVLSKRALESSVIVDDSQIIVLGGLIEDRLSDGSDKVPGLGDLPVVGAAFRYDARRRQKTNLMIFIKPTVLRTGADGREITSERYQYLMGEQARQTPAPRLFWSDPTQPMMPPEGTMPGTPDAPVTAPLLGDRYPGNPGYPLSPAPPPPPAPQPVPAPATPK